MPFDAPATRLCRFCQERPATVAFWMDGGPILCRSCYTDALEADRRRMAAQQEVRRHGYADRISLYCFRIIRNLVMDGSLPDASLETLRSHNRQWWLGCYGVGKVRLAELERLMR